MTGKKIIDKIIGLVIILVAAASSIAVLLLVFPVYMFIPLLTEPTKWIADHQGWFGLFLVFIFIYHPVIDSFIGLARKHSGALLNIAAFLPWALIASSSEQAFGLGGMFLWGRGGFGWGPEGGATVAGPTGEYIPLILAMILLSAGGVLGLFGYNRKFFNRKFSFVGGVLGVIAIVMWLVWVGNHIGWELWKSLFWASADGFSSVSFGFFAATTGSYLLLTTRGGCKSSWRIWRAPRRLFEARRGKESIRENP